RCRGGGVGGDFGGVSAAGARSGDVRPCWASLLSLLRSGMTSVWRPVPALVWRPVPASVGGPVPASVRFDTGTPTGPASRLRRQAIGGGSTSLVDPGRGCDQACRRSQLNGP